MAASMILCSVASRAGERGGQAAFGEDEDAVADGQQLGQLAGGHDDADPLAHEAVDQAVELGLGADIDAAGGIVEQQDLRLASAASGR